MSEPGCRSVRICLNSKWSQIQTIQIQIPKPVLHMVLNWDKIDCPEFNSGKSFVTILDFFRVKQIQIIDSDIFLPALSESIDEDGYYLWKHHRIMIIFSGC